MVDAQNKTTRERHTINIVVDIVPLANRVPLLFCASAITVAWMEPNGFKFNGTGAFIYRLLSY
jgi:hypothetical protein